MSSLRNRVAAVAVAATALALALSVVAVGVTFFLGFRSSGQWDQWGWWGPWDGQPPGVTAGRSAAPIAGPTAGGARAPGEQRDSRGQAARDRTVDDGDRGFGSPGAYPGPGSFDGSAFDGRAFASSIVRGLAIINLGVLAVAGAAALLLTGVALRPLVALRDAAERVASTRDLATRLPADGPVEVRSVAGSLNAMLARLQRSIARTEETLEASRRFTADAGHELRTPLTSMRANLDVLRRSPNLSTAEAPIMDDVNREQARLLALLDGLQRLARADAADAIAREQLDLADIVDAAVVDARRRHPEADIRFDGPEDVDIRGWSDGLRLLVDNLVDNAVVHGGPRTRIAVTLAFDGSATRSEGARIRLAVDDDGPGVPVADRARVFDRFVRGSTAGATGSGLGLALVAQQAAVHGGSVSIADAPLGGARVTVLLDAAATTGTT